MRSTDSNRRFYLSTKQSRTPDAEMPLAKFVGTYIAESQGISLQIDLHQGKLVARMPEFPDGIALLSTADNRFRTDGSHDTRMLNFDIVDGRVESLTLARPDSAASIKLRWNP
jgi:hypothetical protein